MTPSLADDQVITALGDFLTAVLPAGTEIAVGQANRVPEPTGPDHVIITPARRTQLSTTTHDYDGNAWNAVGRSTAFDFQLDIYGPNAADNAQVVSTLLRDAYGCDFLKSYGVQPLYCNDGQQMPLVNGEFQYESRWMMTATLQASPEIVAPAEFAYAVITSLEKAD